MIQAYNRCYPSFGVQPPQFNMMMNPPQQPQQQKAYNGKSETRKAIDHYSYALNEEIGRGFSSKVYKGRDEHTQNPVAVKVIDMKMVKQSIHSVLLKNEINALKAFNSKNILKLFDVFQTQNNTYLITEFCDSGDLSNRIKRRGRLEEAEAIRIMKEVVGGLNEINQKGYIHRDIKPANILMDGQTPKIADFGFAVQINSNDARSQSKHFNVGTPLYMSPQALRQQGHNEKGDVWAVGVMFFEMIYGRPPFTAQSEAALLSNILHQTLTIPAQPAVSDMCKDFIRRCLQVDEGRRFRVKEMASHAMVAQDKPFKLPSAVVEVQERVPLKQISPNNYHQPSQSSQPTQPSQQNQQKEKRSHSQGIREYNSRPIKSENVLKIKSENVRPPSTNVTIFAEPSRLNKRSPTDVSNMQIDPKDLVGRSKSQKHMLEVKQVSRTQRAGECPSPNQNFRRQQSFEQPAAHFERENRRPGTFIQEDKPAQNKFKGNNDILFSQINYCRFLYKFSQQLMASVKSGSKILLNLREKLLFILAKNIAIKINRLSQLNEKENFKDNNLFQLEDYENYKKSDSFQKFSQAIWEYNEKYKKHFEKIFNLVQKNGSSNDKKFETLVDRDFNEYESFYFTAQSYLKQAITDLNQETSRVSESELAGSEHQNTLWVIENLLDYNYLIGLVLDSWNDYRRFLKSARVEQFVDRKAKKYCSKDYADLQQRFSTLK